MSIGLTELNEVSDTTGGTAAASGSLTLTTHLNKVLIALCAVTGSTKQDSAVTGNNITWTVDGVDTFSTFAIECAWAYTGSGATNGAVSFDFTSDDTTGHSMWVAALTGADHFDPVRQFDDNHDSAAGTPTFSLTATHPACALITIVQTGANPPNLTPPTGFTQAYNDGFGSPTMGVDVSYHLSPGSVTSVTYGSATAASYRGVCLEIRPARGGGMGLLGVSAS